MGVQLPQKGGADFLDTIISAQGGQEKSLDEALAVLEKPESEEVFATQEKSDEGDKVGLLTRFFRTKIGKWCTRAYRIAKIAETKPEVVEHVDQRIIKLGLLIGMLVSLTPSFLSGTEKPSKNKGQNDQRPRPEVRASLLESSSSGRQQVIICEDEDEDPRPEPEPSQEPARNKHLGPQVMMAINTSQISPAIMMSAAPNGHNGNVQLFTPPSPTVAANPSSQARELRPEAETIPQPDLEYDNEDDDQDADNSETNTPSPRISLSAALRGQRQPLLDISSTDQLLQSQAIQSSVWDREMKLTLHPTQGTERSDSWRFDTPDIDESSIELNPEVEFELPPFPREILDQVTYDEGESQLPLEVAYEMAMRIAINTISNGREIWRDIRRENDHYEEETSEPITHAEQIRSNFRDIIAGSSLRIQLGLRKFVLKGGVEFNLPWDDGTLEFEGILRGRYSEQPVDTLTFKATWEQQVLGGNLETEGRVDIRPEGYDPLTYQVSVSFNRSLFNDAAHLSVGAQYRGGTVTADEVSFTFGMVFHLDGPRDTPENVEEHPGEGRTERRFRRRYRVSRLLERMARKGQDRYQDQEPLAQTESGL